MRIAVCGGRDLPPEKVALKLGAMLNWGVRVDCVIHGAYRGADEGADLFAKRNGIKPLPFKADWRSFGRRAGPHRNRKMLREGRPHILIAFPGGDGTADCVAAADEIGIPVLRVTAADMPL